MSFTPLDPNVLKASIAKELGDIINAANPGGVIHDNIETIWGQFNDKGAIDAYLQFLFAKRKAIDYLLGATWSKVDRAIGPMHINFTNAPMRLEAMQKDIDGEIVERQQSIVIPLASQIARTAPVMPGDIPLMQVPATGVVFDANDPRLEGSPYFSGLLPR